jgi:Asp-tRNA(Asn)/Glu-tRNA(Gln) amidotransferase A subunit family amidase
LEVEFRSFGGLYGLRPTAQRVPNAGCRTYVPGRDSILGTFGPICHTAEDVELFMNVVTGESASPWRTDPNLLEMPWGVGRNGKWEGGRKLRIGIMRDDGCVMPGAAIRELIEKSEQKLREGGEVEVVEFKPWKMREGWEIIRKLVRSSFVLLFILVNHPLIRCDHHPLVRCDKLIVFCGWRKTDSSTIESRSYRRSMSLTYPLLCAFDALRIRLTFVCESSLCIL